VSEVLEALFLVRFVLVVNLECISVTIFTFSFSQVSLVLQSLLEPVADLDLSGCSSPPQDRGRPLGRPPLRAQPKSRQLQLVSGMVWDRHK
jgi:hypothetical protein